MVILVDCLFGFLFCEPVFDTEYYPFNLVTLKFFINQCFSYTRDDICFG